MNLGAAELIMLMLFALPVAVIIWGIVDAARRPDWAWAQAGQNKVLWVALQAGGLFACGVGFVLAIVYLASIRPKVAAAEAVGGTA